MFLSFDVGERRSAIRLGQAVGQAGGPGCDPLAHGLVGRVGAAQGLAGNRVASGTEQPPHRLLSDDSTASQILPVAGTEPGQPGPDPPPRRVPGRRVVVDERAARRAFDVAGGGVAEQVLVTGAGGHAGEGHHRDHPAPRLLAHSGAPEGPAHTSMWTTWAYVTGTVEFGSAHPIPSCVRDQPPDRRRAAGPGSGRARGVVARKASLPRARQM